MRIFTSVSRYIQGPNTIDELGKHCLDWGKKPLIITDEIIKELLGERLSRSFERSIRHYTC